METSDKSIVSHSDPGLGQRKPWETGDVSHSGSCQNLHESAAFIVDAFYNGGEERDVASPATKKSDKGEKTLCKFFRLFW